MQKDLKALFGKDHGLDDKSVDFLTKALEKNNLPGFDYIEFKQSLAALAAMNLDESTAMRSAFATASTVGLTKMKLLETAEHYKKVLKDEKAQFDGALQKQVSQRVAGKEKEVEKLKLQIQKHEEKIAQLREQISKFQSTIDGADAQIQEAKSKIEATAQSFEMTHQSILNQIEKDIENIQQYL
jgi:septal ring factor EnvC (AmiA/AmiB activator)